jgi:polyketide cyclase/dehydrase/lipid transport protein
LERKAPSHWKIEGYVDKGGHGTITYTLTPKEDGTRFERVFEYEMPNFLLSFLDRLFIRSRIDGESSRAVAKLKQVVESQPNLIVEGQKSKVEGQ